MKIVEKSNSLAIAYENTAQGAVYRRIDTGQYHLAGPKGMISLTTGCYLLAGTHIDPKEKLFVPVNATLIIE